jgi:hypothetical protein
MIPALASLRRLALLAIFLTLIGFGTEGSPANETTLPIITVTAPDTVITQSCRVVIPMGTIIGDVTGQGVLCPPRVAPQHAAR